MYSNPRDADAALGQCSFFSCKERALRERNAFRVSEGLMNPISAHARSHPLALALREQLSGTVDELKRKTKQMLYFCHSEPVRTPVRDLFVWL